MNALVDWVYSVPGRSAISQDEFPENARMIVVLDGLVREINSSGLFYVADHEIGDHCADIVRWLGRIGAANAVAYLEAFARLFPQGVVPASPEERVEKLSRSKRYDFDDLIDPIDRQYRETVLEEIPQRLVAYLREHAAEVERESQFAARQVAGGNGGEVLPARANTLSSLSRIRAVALRQDQREGAAARGPLPALGDIIEVFAKERFAYLQVTHEHFYHESRGPVVRVLGATPSQALRVSEVAQLVAGKELYFTLFNVRRYVRSAREDPGLFSGKVTIRTVANLPVPAWATAFPRFLFHLGQTRDGRNAWGTWTGGEDAEGQFISPLGDELKALPHASINEDPERLVARLKDKWKPIDGYLEWGDV